MALTDSLVAHWSLANTADDAGANTLTNNNVVTFVAGKVGNCANFVAASSQRLSIADNAALSVGDIDFTIAAWAYLASKGAPRIIVAKYTLQGNQREYAINFNNTTDRFQFIVSPDGSSTGLGVAVANTLGSPSLATWYYIVAWHDAAGNTVNIQVNNGATESVAHSTGVLNSTAIFNIGAQLGTTGAAEGFHDGRVDQLFLKKGLFTADEKTWLFNGGAGRTYAEVLAGIPTYKRAWGSPWGSIR